MYLAIEISAGAIPTLGHREKPGLSEFLLLKVHHGAELDGSLADCLLRGGGIEVVTAGGYLFTRRSLTPWLLV